MFQTVQRQFDRDGETVLGYRVQRRDGTTSHVPSDPANRDFQRVQAWISQNGEPESVVPAGVPGPYDLAVMAIDNHGVGSPWVQAAFRETALLREFGQLPQAGSLAEAQSTYRQQALDWLAERRTEIEGR